MSHRSGIRLRPVRRAGLDLVALALTSDDATLEELARAAPPALRVEGVPDREALADALGAGAVLCAVVADMDMVRTLGEHLAQVGERWGGLPVLAVVRAASPDALARAADVASHRVLRNDPVLTRERIEHRFLRGALDARLAAVARVLAYADARRLDGATRETFVAYAIEQTRRDELADRLGVEERSVEKRIRRLCEALGVSRLADVGQLLAGLPPVPPDPERLRAIEDLAAARRGIDGAGKPAPRAPRSPHDLAAPRRPSSRSTG
ncbi:MAG: hypothetical protein KF729_15245 [Sandaracinaceae bacterium]|nr:hypothetical protein [Sandaracinaceae bacterium]